MTWSISVLSNYPTKNCNSGSLFSTSSAGIITKMAVVDSLGTTGMFMSNFILFYRGGTDGTTSFSIWRNTWKTFIRREVGSGSSCSRKEDFCTRGRRKVRRKWIHFLATIEISNSMEISTIFNLFTRATKTCEVTTKLQALSGVSKIQLTVRHKWDLFLQNSAWFSKIHYELSVMLQLCAFTWIACFGTRDVAAYRGITSTAHSVRSWYRPRYRRLSQRQM